MTYAVLLVTAPDRAAAKALAQDLVTRHLAACVQMLPIDSVYEWQGKVEEATEILLLCKIRRQDYAEIEAAILKQHSYETPEIVMLPIEAGFSDYLSWIDSVTKLGG
ncbi:MAG: divalent-cation tolerance protein CutA [Methylovirgula sp.]